MRVLYLSYDGLTDPLGQSQILPYLIGLTKKGHSFSIISFEKEINFNKQKNEIYDLCKAHNLNWIPLMYTKRPPVLSTLFDLWRMKKTVQRIAYSHPFEIIHCRSYLTGIIGMNYAKAKNLKWVFDMRGFWADERIDGNIWNLKSPIYNRIYAYFKRKEIELINDANAIVSLTFAAKRYLESESKFAAKKGEIHVIPCCVNLNRFDLNSNFQYTPEEINQQLNITSSDFVVGYLGSLGTWYLLPEMLQLFKRIRLQNPSAVFCFITNEPFDSIASEVNKLDIPIEQIRVKSVPQKFVPNYIARFNCSPFFILPSFSKMASSPVKQGELMAMGIPIICNEGVGDTSEIIQKYAAGQIINLSSERAIEQFELNLDTFNKETAIKGAFEYFNLENGVASYDRIYQNM